MTSSSPLAEVSSPAGQDPPDHEIDDQPADGTEELADLHELARLVRLLDDRVLAVRLHRRSRCRPDEVGTPDARIPVVAEPGVDVLPHLVEDAVVPAGAGGLGAFLADEPDGRRESGRSKGSGAIAISVWIGQLPSTTKPARMIAETKVSHASGCL